MLVGICPRAGGMPMRLLCPPIPFPLHIDQEMKTNNKLCSLFGKRYGKENGMGIALAADSNSVKVCCVSKP